MSSPSLFDQLAQIADLTWQGVKEVPIERSSDIPRARAAILNSRGLLPAPDQLPEELRQGCLTEPGRADDEALQSTIFDVLGEYYSAKRKIVIYDRLISAAAIALEIDADLLTDVVLAHEIAHAVTHLGKDAHDGVWKHFATALTEDKELFAQIYPYLLFRETSQVEPAAVMDRLTDYQPPHYRAWKDLTEESVDEINARLTVARAKAPPDFSISRAFMGFGLNMGISGNDSGLILGDGRAYHGMDWGFGFQLGQECPARVDSQTLEELREVVVRSGVMNIGPTAFGPEAFMDGGTTTLTLRIGNQERSFEARCGDWGRYSQQFNEIERAFKKAFKQAAKK